MNAIINANIYDFESYKENQYILYNKEIIVEIGNMTDYKKQKNEIDAQNSIVMPGLTNAHTHIYSAFARGVILPKYNPKNFKEILEQMWWKLDSKLDLDAIYYSGLISAVEFIKNGVTSFIDHHASGAIDGSLNMLKKSLCDEWGMRGIFCFETSDRFDIDKCIKENLSFINNSSENFRGMFGMHASMTLSDKTLEKIKNEIDENTPIHIHIAESIADQMDSLKKSGLKVIERLDNFDLIRKNSILAHCVHIDENEMQIIKNKKAYIASNLISNMNNAVGIIDYEKIKNFDIPILIGNDGMGYNITKEYSNIYFLMKHLKKNHTFFSFDDLLQIIKNNYSYISKMLGIKIGKIEADYKADLIIVPYMPYTPINNENIHSHFFFGMLDNFHPSHVIINGSHVLHDYEFYIDLDMIYSESREIAEKVWKNL